MTVNTIPQEMIAERKDELALVPVRTRELAKSFVTEINQRHQEGLECDQQLRDIVARKFEVTAATAALIIEAQETLKGRFDQLVARYLNFGPPQLRGYTRIVHRARPSKDFRSKWKSIGAFGQPTGLVPIPDGHGKQVLRPPNFFSLAERLLLNLLSAWEKHVTRDPLTQWDIDALEQCAEQLKRIVDVYSQIRREIATR